MEAFGLKRREQWWSQRYMGRFSNYGSQQELGGRNGPFQPAVVESRSLVVMQSGSDRGTNAGSRWEIGRHISRSQDSKKSGTRKERSDPQLSVPAASEVQLKRHAPSR
jgi:hypothetical protein